MTGMTVQKVTKRLTLNFALAATGLALASGAHAHCEKPIGSKSPQLAHAPVVIFTHEKTIENHFE